MAYSKPYLAPAQQLDLIEARGMLVTDRERAISCLKRIGYYRLSAYWYPFRKSESVSGSSGSVVRRVLDGFRPGTSFSLVMDLYVFDKKLRILVLDAIERIEIALRTDIALLIGQYGSWAHRDPAKLHGNFSRRPAHPGASYTKHEKWLSRLDDKFTRSNEDFAKHFHSKYPGEHMPIWIAVELWDFGMLSHFFSGMNVRDREAIAQQHAVKSWLQCRRSGGLPAIGIGQIHAVGPPPATERPDVRQRARRPSLGRRFPQRIRGRGESEHDPGKPASHRSRSC